MIRLSIIIPHKNSPLLLSRCIESIPDIEEFEVIIVDDNSNDHIVDFINFPGRNRKYTHIYETKEGKGAGYARNIGISYAKGEWLMFADADDYFTSNFHQDILSFLEEKYDLICFPVICLDNKSQYFYSEINTIINSSVYSNKEKAISIVTPFAKLIKTNYIKENRISFEEIKYGNDIMFSINAALNTENIYIEKKTTFYVYNIILNSLSHTITVEALYSRLNTSIRQYKYLKNNNYGSCMRQINSIYLAYARRLGKHVFFYTTLKLLFSGLLVYKAKYKKISKTNYILSNIKNYIKIF